MDRIPKTRNGCVIITAVLTQTTLFVKLYNYLLLLVLATILTIIIFNIIILIIAIFLTTIAEKVHLIRQSLCFLCTENCNWYLEKLISHFLFKQLI